MDKRDVLDARGLLGEWVTDDAPTLIPDALLTDHTPTTVAPIPDEIGGYRVMVGEIEVWRCGELPAGNPDAVSVFEDAHMMAATVRDEVQKWREAVWRGDEELGAGMFDGVTDPPVHPADVVREARALMDEKDQKITKLSNLLDESNAMLFAKETEIAELQRVIVSLQNP